MKKINNALFIYDESILPRPTQWHLEHWHSLVKADKSEIAFRPVNCRVRFGKDYEVRICLGGRHYLLCIVPLADGIQAARIADHARFFFRGYSNRKIVAYNFPVCETSHEEFDRLQVWFRTLETTLLGDGLLKSPKERKNRYKARFEQMEKNVKALEDVVDKMLTRLEALEREVG